MLYFLMITRESIYTHIYWSFLNATFKIEPIQLVHLMFDDLVILNHVFLIEIKPVL